MEKNSEFKETKFITGLRAYAALLVFIVHYFGKIFSQSESGILKYITKFIINLVDYGRQGVVIFFVISAFTICMSIDKCKFNILSYIIKRFFRVVPLYYIVTLIFYYKGGAYYYLNMFSIKNDAKNLLTHFSFYNLFDIRFQNSIIGLEWTVPIEFCYYLILPLIFFLLKKINELEGGLIFLVISLLIPSLSNVVPWIFPFYDSANPELWYHWSMWKYLFSFLCGVITYLLHKKYSPNGDTPKYLMALLIIIIGGIYFNIQEILYVSVSTSALIILLRGENNIISKIFFENSIIQYLGKISYSFYLLHLLSFYPKFQFSESFIINQFVLTIILSSASYYIIEKPFVWLGKKITYLL